MYRIENTPCHIAPHTVFVDRNPVPILLEYHDQGGILHVRRWAHSGRKIMDVIKAQGKNRKTGREVAQII